MKTNFSSHSLFYKELGNIRQTHITNNFPNYIVNEQIKLAKLNKIKMNTFRISNANDHPVINNKYNEFIL